MRPIPLTLLAATAFALTASEQVTLEIKQTEKATLTQASEIKLKQILNIAGQEIETESHQKFTVKSITGEMTFEVNG